MTNQEPALSEQLSDRMRELGRVVAPSISGLNRQLGLGVSNTQLRRALKRTSGVTVGRPRPDGSDTRHYVVTYRA